MARVYDLEDRLLRFAVSACRFAESLDGSQSGAHIRGQLVRCATSPSANYAEARAGESRRDFIHKMRLCLKELRETRAWLRLALSLNEGRGEMATPLIGEADELISIFVVSLRTARNRE